LKVNEDTKIERVGNILAIRALLIIIHYISLLLIIKPINMLLSTTNAIEGKKVLEYRGIVFGETIIGANILKDLFANIRDIVGGRSGSYEQVLAEARNTSLQEMQYRAQQSGANAIIGIDIDYEVMGNSGSMLMVSCSGTAVVVE
jgi:uncharacterized protein YbjQ (UPF0145 family)